MRRRTFIASAAAGLAAPALAAPALAQGAAKNVLKFVPDVDIVSLDPVWTTSYQTRDHGYMVYDTLYGQNAAFEPTPQMLEGHVVEDDGKTWKMTLRDGLKFHDGTKVLARDCVASIKRWAARDGFGQSVAAVTDEMSAPDDKTIVIKLKTPFPLLPTALCKISPSMCAIMPQHLAETDPYKQITDATGSGPFRWKADEHVAGARAVWERNPDYVPRSSGTPEWTSGPKIAKFERIEWTIIQDPSTAMAALQTGEVDWWYTPSADLLPVLQKSKGVATPIVVPTGTIATMRFNQLQPPFDNPAIRRAIVHAVSQSDYMIAMNGTDQRLWRDGVGFFCPDTPMASSAGMENLTSKRNLDAVKKELEQAGYKGEKVAFLAPMNISYTKALAEVTGDLLPKIGINLDFQAMDWGTVLQRRAKMDPIDQGGWSIFQTSWAGLDQLNPAVHVFLRGNGKQAIVGWPTAPKIEALRDQWMTATTLDAQKEIARQIQLQAFVDVPYIPLGQSLTPTACRADLKGMLQGLPIFWNVERA
jgi:peptide/nickel transport system substrate-binding protein